MSNQVHKQMSKYYDMPNHNLLAYLKRQEVGSEIIVTTPFAQGEPTPAMLKQWAETLKTIEGEWPSLFAFEIDMSKKVGPMSYQRPLHERIESIQSYFQLDEYERGARAISEDAINQTLAFMVKGRGMRPRSEQKVLENMKLSTNSGSPFFTKRRLVAEKEINAVVGFPEDALPTAFYQKATFDLCATLGWRGQEGGPSVDDTKQRVLWMFPMSLNIKEATIYQPLIQMAQKFNFVPPWNGNEAVDQAFTNMFATKGAGDLIICTDFTNFDAHFNTYLQDAAISILLQLVETKKKPYYENVLRSKYYLPLCIDDGVFMVGHHGMASGSGGTNADETLVHMALQREAAMTAGRDLNRYSMCLGDDGVLTYPGATVEHVLQTYTGHGLEMNPSKQYVSTDDAIFLRRWHHKDYVVDGVNVGVYPTMRALGRLRYMERFVDPKMWGRAAVAMRELSVIENCKYHPLFPEFVKFCVKRDKYRLGLDIPGFFEHLNEEWEEAKANDITYTSYSAMYNDPTPPAEWRVVKELKAFK